MSKPKPIKEKDITMDDVYEELREPDALLPMPKRKGLERDVIVMAHSFVHELRAKWDMKMMLKRCERELALTENKRSSATLRSERAETELSMAKRLITQHERYIAKLTKRLTKAGGKVPRMPKLSKEARWNAELDGALLEALKDEGK